MESIIDLLTDSNGHHAVGESDIKDAIIEVRKICEQNAALRAAVKEMKRVLPVLEAVEIQHPGALSEYTPDGTLANVSAYRQTLETALAKMNEK